MTSAFFSGEGTRSTEEIGSVLLIDASVIDAGVSTSVNEQHIAINKSSTF
jgi:hypothetical protein